MVSYVRLGAKGQYGMRCWYCMSAVLAYDGTITQIVKSVDSGPSMSSSEPVSPVLGYDGDTVTATTKVAIPIIASSLRLWLAVEGVCSISVW
jgi:hypothetical protein